MKYFCIIFIVLYSFINYAQNKLAISDYAFDNRYKEHSFSHNEIKELIQLSKSFSGLPKVSEIYKNKTEAPYYKYDSVARWPIGSWGRGYENAFDNDGGTAISKADNVRFYNLKNGYNKYLACQPLMRDVAFFVQGHLHLYLLGFEKEENLQKIKDGIDYILSEQITDNTKNKGAYNWYYSRKKINKFKSYKEIDDYETSHALSVLSEIYLAEIPYRRNEIIASIRLSTENLTKNYDFFGGQKKKGTVWSNTRGLGLWSLSLAYKVLKDNSLLEFIRITTKKHIETQAADGQWKFYGDPEIHKITDDVYDASGKLIQEAPICTTHHDQKIFYHFMALRGLIETFSILENSDALKQETYLAINKAMNHVIDHRTFKLGNEIDFIPDNNENKQDLFNREFRLRYYYQDDEQKATCTWNLYTNGIEKYIETVAKLAYYSKDTEYYSVKDQELLLNFTHRLAKGLRSDNLNFVQPVAIYCNYIKAITNNTEIYQAK